jgi:intracellular sulfur oxidation DsrE/DsrF family protein
MKHRAVTNPGLLLPSQATRSQGKEKKMKRNSRPLIVVLVLLVGTLLSSGIAYGGGSEALKGLDSVKAVFDFRTGDPAKAVIYLTLIGDTFNNQNIQKVTKSPDFVVSLGGHSVKLLAKDTTGFSPEERKMIDEIKARISALAKEGIKFEYCSYAATLLGVEPAEVPGVRIIDNGWVSLIGYQGRGYSLVLAD